MDFSSICRTCLCTKYLSSIFKDDDDEFSSTIFTITGLQVKINDGLPQQMCKACMKFIKESVKFRQTCKKAEIQLLSIKDSQECHDQIILPIHKTKRKKSIELKNTHNIFNIKIEPDFDNDDDVPLLQKKLHFTNSTDQHKNIEIDMEFVKIDENDEESVKNEGNDDNTHDEFTNNIENTIYENEQIIVHKSGFDEENDENRQELDIQFTDKERTHKNELEDNEVKIDKNTSNESKFDQKFDSDKHLTVQMEITYNEMEFPNNDMEFPKQNMEVPSKTETTEYLSFPNDNIENSNYNCMKIMKIKGKKLKNRKRNKNSLLISNIDVEIQNEDENIFVHNLEVKKENAEGSEDLPFMINDDNRVTCKLCQKDLSKRSIDVHMVKSHPGADTRRVKCELCETYVLKDRMIRHKTEKHGLDSFVCGYCKTVFNCKESLLEHVSTCTEKKRKRKPGSEKNKEKVTECDICKKTMLKASLRMHKAIKHGGMGPVCEHCGRRFGNKNRLSEHLRAKHGHEKFKCSLCHFLSASSLAMKNHERRHRGEKPYVCEQCEARFHARHLLSQHKQSHRTEKNMKCDQCPAAFKANNSLHMHKMTCHKNNTYQCPMCPRTYNSRHYVVKHLRNVHRHIGAVGPLIEGPREPDAGAEKHPNVGPKCPDSTKYIMSCTVTAGP